MKKAPVAVAMTSRHMRWVICNRNELYHHIYMSKIITTSVILLSILQYLVYQSGVYDDDDDDDDILTPYNYRSIHTVHTVHTSFLLGTNLTLLRAASKN